jgi:hypothetical protein
MKLSSRTKKILVAIVIIAFLLSFRSIAEPVVKAAGAVVDLPKDAVDTVVTVAKNVFAAGVLLAGVYLLGAAAATASLVIALPLLVIGVALLAVAAWSFGLFGKKKEDQLPAGQKPDNTNLGGFWGK